MVIIAVHSEPEKTMGESGVVPITVLKEESICRNSISLYLAFIIRNLFCFSCSCFN